MKCSHSLENIFNLPGGYHAKLRKEGADGRREERESRVVRG